MNTTQPQQEPSPKNKNYAADEQNQTKAVSKEFVKAAKENVVGQIVGIIFFSLILDGGFLLNRWLISCLAYWVGFAFIRLRRPVSPTKFDILFLHLGAVMLFTVSIVVVSIMSYIFVGRA